MSTTAVGAAASSGVYRNEATGDATALSLSPEGLIALCAMQLQKFDGQILGLMSEQQGMEKLNAKLANITKALESFGDGIGPDNMKGKDDILRELDSMIHELGSSPERANLKQMLEAKRDQIRNGSNPANHLKSGPDFTKAMDQTAEDRSKLSAEQLQYADALMRGAELMNWKTGELNEGVLNALPGLTEEQKSYIKSRAAEHKSYLAAEGDRIGRGELSKSDVEQMTKELKDLGNNLSSRKDSMLIQLNTLASQRSTSLQMFSNLTNSLLESTKAIASNIGR